MAQSTYNPNNQVAPTGAPSNDYLNVQASPNDFGAQIGQAQQGLGKTLETSENQFMGIALQQQGLANEHAASAAEMELAVQGGNVYNQYKSLTGFDAANTKDKAIADYLKVNDSIRASLPNPAAQRAYDQLATRRMSFTIQDMNSYAAEQQKKGYITSRNATMNLNVDAASKYEVASNPQQLGFALGSVRFDASDLFTNPEYGTYRTVPATQNKDGSVSFNTDTAQGKAAQADYDNYVNQAIGKTYKNAVETLAYDPQHGNVMVASQFLSDNQSKMPAATFAQLAHSLAPAIKQEQARSSAHDYADSVLAQAGTPSGPSYPTNPGNVKTSDGSFANPTTPLDGVVLTANNLRSGYQGMTLSEIAKKWTGEGPDKVSDWINNASKASGLSPDSIPNLNDPTVLRQVVKGISVAEKSPQDRGAFTDDVINRGVSASLSGQKANLSQGIQGIPSNVAQGADSYRNQAVYVGTHMPELIDNARRLAEEKFPDDSPTQDAFVSHVTQRLGNVVSAQRSADLQDKQSIIGFIQKQGVTSEQQIMSGPPQIRDAWLRMNGNDTYAATGFRNYIAANAQGKQVVLGTDFYKYLQSSLRGETQNPADLENAIVPQKGAHSPLTNTGVDFIRGRLDPNEHSFNQAMSQYLETQHKLYTGGSLAGAKDSESSPEFDKALLDIIPKIQAGKQRGLTAQQMFSPEINGKVNPDYISAAVAPPATSTLFARQASRILSQVSTTSQAVTDYKTLDDIKKAKDAGKLTYQQAVDLGRKKGLIAPEAPKVPMDLN